MPASPFTRNPLLRHTRDPPKNADRGTVLGWNDDGGTSNVVVKFDDTSRYWFPAKTVAAWVTSQAPAAAAGARTGTPLRGQLSPARGAAGLNSPARKQRSAAAPASPPASPPTSPRRQLRQRPAAAAAAAKQQPASPKAPVTRGRAQQQVQQQKQQGAAGKAEREQQEQTPNGEFTILLVLVALLMCMFAGSIWLATKLRLVRA
jgi:hypothetical protein